MTRFLTIVSNLSLSFSSTALFPLPALMSNLVCVTHSVSPPYHLSLPATSSEAPIFNLLLYSLPCFFVTVPPLLTYIIFFFIILRLFPVRFPDSSLFPLAPRKVFSMLASPFSSDPHFLLLSRSLFPFRHSPSPPSAFLPPSSHKAQLGSPAQ